VTDHEDADRALSRVDAALGYAASGWPCFPVQPEAKTPLTQHGLKDATTNQATIRRWWSLRPDAAIGVVTGAASGLVVIDLDPTERP